MSNFNKNLGSSVFPSLRDDAKKLQEDSKKAIDQELEKRGLDRKILMTYYENLPQDLKDYLDQEFTDLVIKDESGSVFENSDLNHLRKFIELQSQMKELCPVDISISSPVTEKNIKERSHRKKANRYRRWV